MSVSAKSDNNASANSVSAKSKNSASATPGTDYTSGVGTIAIIGCGIAAIVLFIRSTISTSDLIGGTENWRAIKPQVNQIWWSTAVGAVILFIGMFAYVLQYEKASVVFILLISCIALALSFAAISMSAISISGATPSN